MGLDLAQALLLKTLLPLALLILAGALWPRWQKASSAVDLRGDLSRLVLNFFAPMLFFVAGATAHFEPALVQIPATLVITTLAGMALAAWLTCATRVGRGLTRPQCGVIVLAAGFGNVLFFGYAFLSTVYGEAGTRYPFYADLFATSPLIWSLGVWVAYRFGDHGERVSFWRMWLRLPPVWAFVAGFAVNASGLALDPLIDAARWAGGPTVPLMLFVLGLTIPWHDLRPSRAVVVGVAIKLVAAPLIGLAVALVWPGPLTHALEAGVLEAAMPTMVMVIALADRFGLDARLAGLMMGWSTLAGLLTLPLWLIVVKGLAA